MLLELNPDKALTIHSLRPFTWETVSNNVIDPPTNRICTQVFARHAMRHSGELLGISSVSRN